MTEPTLTLTRAAIKEIAREALLDFENRRGEENRRGHPELGGVLRKHMDRAEFSLRILSERTGASSSMISKIIAGARLPSQELLARFRRNLGDEFLIEWFDKVEMLDTASRVAGDLVYARVERNGKVYIVRQQRYQELFRRCQDANRRVFGQAYTEKCARDIDALIRQEVETYGELAELETPDE